MLVVGGSMVGHLYADISKLEAQVARCITRLLPDREYDLLSQRDAFPAYMMIAWVSFLPCTMIVHAATYTVCYTLRSVRSSPLFDYALD